MNQGLNLIFGIFFLFMPWLGLVLVGISVDIYAIVGETVMSLCRSGNMPISLCPSPYAIVSMVGISVE